MTVNHSLMVTSKCSWLTTRDLGPIPMRMGSHLNPWVSKSSPLELARGWVNPSFLTYQFILYFHFWWHIPSFHGSVPMFSCSLNPNFSWFIPRHSLMKAELSHLKNLRVLMRQTAIVFEESPGFCRFDPRFPRGFWGADALGKGAKGCGEAAAPLRLAMVKKNQAWGRFCRICYWDIHMCNII